MAYIGIQPAESFTSFATQTFSVSATTSYTLDHAVANENEIALFVNNVRQQPGSGKAYTATGTALTLSAATASTDTMYCVFLGRALQTVNPATNSITSSMLGGTFFTGATDVGGALADADLFLIDDGAGGTLRKTAASRIKTYVGGGISEFDMFRLTTQFQGNATPISSNLERCDTHSFEKIGTGMTESSGVFTFPSTGKYHVIYTLIGRNAESGGERHHQGLIDVTTDGTNFTNAAQASNNIGYYQSSVNNTQSSITSIFFDVTNTSTHKVRFLVYANGDSNTYTAGNTGSNNTTMTFIRIGDT